MRGPTWVRGIDTVHDISLVVWAALAAVRATGQGRAGRADAVVVAVNLVSGAPSAWQRVTQHRRDLVAVVAPLAVTCAVVTTVRPRPLWAPVAATSVLLALRAIERAGGGQR